MDYVSDWYLKQLRKVIESGSVPRETPLIDFGKMGIQSNSYSVGMLMFRVTSNNGRKQFQQMYSCLLFRLLFKREVQR